jgi:hypothetical protein
MHWLTCMFMFILVPLGGVWLPSLVVQLHLHMQKVVFVWFVVSHETG